MTALGLQRTAGVGRRLDIRPLRSKEREVALANLDRAPRLNLLLTDLVLRLGDARPGEPRSEVLAAWDGGALQGLVGLQPSVVLDAAADREVLDAFLPYLGGVGTGLVKSTEDVVGPLWDWLESRGRRALLDRIENAYVLEPREARLPAPDPTLVVRRAEPADLDALVEAARASLLEEGRPDPSPQDPHGFRRWVHGRSGRATIVERAGRIAFVGYADVQCERGWLLQGVYTWPELRRQGLARAGVGALCRSAFAAGADHVQLAVVDGNEAAEGLYEALGFKVHARLRTLLFC